MRNLGTADFSMIPSVALDEPLARRSRPRRRVSLLQRLRHLKAVYEGRARSSDVIICHTMSGRCIYWPNNVEPPTNWEVC